MPLKLVAPINKEFTLNKTDEYYGVTGDPSKVTIRQATQGDNEKRTNLFAEVTRVIEGTKIKTSSRWSYEQLRRLEVYLTLVGCNITDDQDKPIFNFRSLQNGNQVLDMSESHFTEKWNSLPPLVAEEIHEKVLEVNISWDGTAGEVD